LGTDVIIVVVLQSSMDIVKCELGSSTETYVTSTLDGNHVTCTETVRVPVIKEEEEDQEAWTIPVIKTEPKVIN
jgi:hypothetical protein